MSRIKRAVILADGVSKEGHLRDRHMLEVGGEPLLLRSIRQFSEWVDEVIVVCQSGLGQQLPVRWVKGDDKSDRYHQADMIRKGLAHAVEPSSIVVFGDVYFTDQAHQVMRKGNGRSWAIYGRSQDNLGLGRWGEYFAFEVGSGLAWPMLLALERAAKNWREGNWHRCSAWEWYFECDGQPYHIQDPYHVQTGDHWVEISDETDDVDFVEDIRRLERIL